MRFSRPAALVVVALTSLSLATGASAAQREPTPAPGSRVTTKAPIVQGQGVPADETRQALEEVLKQYPPSLARILKLDPTLLNSDGYLQPYPQLAAFLKEHPDVAHNPSYFFAEYGDNGNYFRETPQDRALGERESMLGAQPPQQLPEHNAQLAGQPGRVDARSHRHKL